MVLLLPWWLSCCVMLLLCARDRPVVCRAADTSGRPHHPRTLLSLAAWRTALTWNGVSHGCLLRISATIPVTCGAAKLLQVAVIEPLPVQATSTSMPRAPNSAG